MQIEISRPEHLRILITDYPNMSQTGHIFLYSLCMLEHAFEGAITAVIVLMEL